MASKNTRTRSAQRAPASAAPASGERHAWIDLIRGGGAFLVVLAHVILYPALRGSGPLWAQALYYTASRVAVPLFFMASGFLLLGKQEGYADFFRKRALRVFVPFVVWSLIYLAWNADLDPGPFTLGSVGEALLRVLRGPRAAHLWFFYVLISLYLFTPVLRIFTLNGKVRDLAYFCGLWFLLDPVLNFLRHQYGLQVGFEFLFITGYIGYYVLGHLLGKVPVTRAWAAGAGAVMLLAFAFVFYTVYGGLQAPEYDQFFEGYLSVPVVLMTASAFLLARWLGPRVNGAAMTWIRPLSAASLGIYLLHVLALDVTNTLVTSRLGEAGWGSSIVMMPLTALVGFVICLLVVLGLQRVPVAKYAVP